MTIFPDIIIRKDASKNTDFDWYTLVEDCSYSPLNITIPAGYVTDFSSVPRVLWPFIPPHGRAMAASVLHDYFYTHRPLQPLLSVGPEARVSIERYIADKIFEENLVTAIGMKKWQAKVMYWAVRLFGYSRFKKQGDEK